MGLLFAYFLLTTGLYLGQDKIIFQGHKLPDDYTFKFSGQFSEIKIHPRIGKELSAVLFFTDKEVRKGTILYFHGNADNMQRWGNYAIDFTKLGYNVLMIDYTGYGKSYGRPSEQTFLEDADDTWEWAKMHLKETRFVLYGRSLGTAAASYLATKHKPLLLILETPFYQLLQYRLSIFFPFGLKYDFANYKYIPEIKCPVTIFQGTADWVVSYKSALKLKPLLKAGDQFITIKGGGHKNLRTFDVYHEKLAEVLK